MSLRGRDTLSNQLSGTENQKNSCSPLSPPLMQTGSPLLADDVDNEEDYNIRSRQFSARRMSTSRQTAPQASMMADNRDRAPQASMTPTLGDHRSRIPRVSKKTPARAARSPRRQMSVDMSVNGKQRLPPRSRNGCW